MRPDHITTAEILATAEIERQRQRESLEPPLLRSEWACEPAGDR
jgi:hypothetical protein